MSASLPEPSTPHQRTDWKNVKPLGIYRSLTPRLALSQLSSRLRFIQPLGARSLSVLKPNLFFSDPTLAAEEVGQPFQDFPFFDRPASTPSTAAHGTESTIPRANALKSTTRQRQSPPPRASEVSSLEAIAAAETSSSLSPTWAIASPTTPGDNPDTTVAPTSPSVISPASPETTTVQRQTQSARASDGLATEAIAPSETRASQSPVSPIAPPTKSVDTPETPPATTTDSQATTTQPSSLIPASSSPAPTIQRVSQSPSVAKASPSQTPPDPSNEAVESASSPAAETLQPQSLSETPQAASASVPEESAAKLTEKSIFARVQDLIGALIKRQPRTPADGQAGTTRSASPTAASLESTTIQQQPQSDSASEIPDTEAIAPSKTHASESLASPITPSTTPIEDSPETTTDPTSPIPPSSELTESTTIQRRPQSASPSDSPANQAIASSEASASESPASLITPPTAPIEDSLETTIDPANLNISPSELTESTTIQRQPQSANPSDSPATQAIASSETSPSALTPRPITPPTTPIEDNPETTTDFASPLLTSPTSPKIQREPQSPGVAAADPASIPLDLASNPVESASSPVTEILQPQTIPEVSQSASDGAPAELTAEPPEAAETPTETSASNLTPSPSPSISSELSSEVDLATPPTPDRATDPAHEFLQRAPIQDAATPLEKGLEPPSASTPISSVSDVSPAAEIRPSETASSPSPPSAIAPPATTADGRATTTAPSNPTAAASESTTGQRQPQSASASEISFTEDIAPSETHSSPSPTQEIASPTTLVDSQETTTDPAIPSAISSASPESTTVQPAPQSFRSSAIPTPEAVQPSAASASESLASPIAPLASPTIPIEDRLETTIVPARPIPPSPESTASTTLQRQPQSASSLDTPATEAIAPAETPASESLASPIAPPTSPTTPIEEGHSQETITDLTSSNAPFSESTESTTIQRQPQSASASDSPSTQAIAPLETPASKSLASPIAPPTSPTTPIEDSQSQETATDPASPNHSSFPEITESITIQRQPQSPSASDSPATEAIAPAETRASESLATPIAHPTTPVDIDSPETIATPFSSPAATPASPAPPVSPAPPAFPAPPTSQRKPQPPSVAAADQTSIPLELASDPVETSQPSSNDGDRPSSPGTVASSPQTQSEPSVVDLAMERPFLSGDRTVQKSVALPQVVRYVGVFTPLRSPLMLNPSADEGNSDAGRLASGIESSPPNAPITAEQRSADSLPLQTGTEATPEEAAQLSQLLDSFDDDAESDLGERIQRQVKGPLSRENRPATASSPWVRQKAAEPSRRMATRQSWDSIADLLAQSAPHQTIQTSSQGRSASTGLPAAIPSSTETARSVAAAIALKDPFPNLHALETPTPKIQQQPNALQISSLSPTVIQRLVAADDNVSSEQDGEVSEPGDDTTEGSAAKLDKLAQVMYQMVRQRLAIERERLGRFGSGRFQ